MSLWLERVKGATQQQLRPNHGEECGFSSSSREAIEALGRNVTAGNI